jgi:AraC family transcriptional regulator
VRQGTYTDHCGQILQVIRYIHANFHQPLPISQLAEMACMSPFHFQRVFQEITGEKCARLIRRLRLERAACDIQNTEEPISDIAFRAGFNNVEPFIRAFRSRYGAPPTEFRKARWMGYRIPCANGVHYEPGVSPEFHPLSIQRQGVPFSIQRIEPFPVAARKHHGPPALLAKTSIELAQELIAKGADPASLTLFNFAHGMSARAPISKITSFVAVKPETELPDDLQPAVLGGGLYMVVPYEDRTVQLGDFWFRVWAEALPSCGHPFRPGTCFQEVRHRPDGSFDTTIHIPVEEQIRIPGQA